VRNLSDAWVFDAASNHWSRLPEAPVKRRAWGSAIDGKSILLLGGYTDAFSAEIYRYDVATSSYSPAGRLPHAIADAKYVAIGGKLYSAGGEPEMKVRAAWTIEGVAHETTGHN
jgi:N-acetylneuraminic acid mutarotase